MTIRFLSLVPGAAVLFVGVVVAGCTPDLPELDTAEGRVYLEACGSCHAPIPPSALRFASWEFQVGRMDEFRLARGWGPLPAAQREIVLNYLQKHAG